MNQTEYMKSYFKKHLQRIPVNVPKEQYALLKEYCKNHGETISGLIKRLLYEETGISMKKRAD